MKWGRWERWVFLVHLCHRGGRGAYGGRRRSEKEKRIREKEKRILTFEKAFFFQYGVSGNGGIYFFKLDFSSSIFLACYVLLKASKCFIII